MPSGGDDWQTGQRWRLTDSPRQLWLPISGVTRQFYALTRYPALKDFPVVGGYWRTSATATGLCRALDSSHASAT